MSWIKTKVGLSASVSDDVTADEIALILLCDATNPYLQVKLLARLAQGI